MIRVSSNTHIKHCKRAQYKHASGSIQTSLTIVTVVVLCVLAYVCIKLEVVFSRDVTENYTSTVSAISHRRNNTTSKVSVFHSISVYNWFGITAIVPFPSLKYMYLSYTYTSIALDTRLLAQAYRPSQKELSSPGIQKLCRGLITHVQTDKTCLNEDRSSLTNTTNPPIARSPIEPSENIELYLPCSENKQIQMPTPVSTTELYYGPKQVPKNVSLNTHDLQINVGTCQSGQVDS